MYIYKHVQDQIRPHMDAYLQATSQTHIPLRKKHPGYRSETTHVSDWHIYVLQLKQKLEIFRKLCHFQRVQVGTAKLQVHLSTWYFHLFQTPSCKKNIIHRSLSAKQNASKIPTSTTHIYHISHPKKYVLLKMMIFQTSPLARWDVMYPFPRNVSVFFAMFFFPEKNHPASKACSRSSDSIGLLSCTFHASKRLRSSSGSMITALDREITQMISKF